LKQMQNYVTDWSPALTFCYEFTFVSCNCLPDSISRVNCRVPLLMS
jgi:hypothetical protein